MSNSDTHNAPSRPRTTFFNLPRELRDHFYDLALTTSTPIVAWSGIRPENPPVLKLQLIAKHRLSTARQHRASTSELRNLTANLLRCNSIIAHEVAPIFYGKNKFLFDDDWTWDTVVNWFETIGPRNRGFVSSIELKVVEPSHAWQKRNGERVEVKDSYEPPFPRNRHLYRSPRSRSEGLVETINPALETFFQLDGAPKLLITMSLHADLFPGFQISSDAFCPQRNWFSMDLPNVIEKLRAMYTTETGRSFDVVWKGHIEKGIFLKGREAIQTKWEILCEEEEVHTCPSRPDHPMRTLLEFIRYTMKSKEVTEPLLAEEPSPYSIGWGTYRLIRTLSEDEFLGLSYRGPRAGRVGGTVGHEQEGST